MKTKRYHHYKDAALIRHAIDSCPDGILVAAMDGRPILANQAINEISLQLTGSTVMNAQEFWNQVEEHALQPFADTTEGGVLACLVDGRVWQFTRRSLMIHQTEVYQYDAAEVTELYRYQKELRESNARTQRLHERQRDLMKEIVQNNLEKEALQAKMHIHDEIGQALILTRNALETKESPMEMDNLYSMWENLVRDMENAAVSKNVKVSDPEEELKQVAAMIGCRVRFSGRQPRERKALLLLYAGIREALTNAVRHAGADELLVEIKESGSFYEVSIGSNGTRPVEGTVREGSGLGGLRKRIESEGGVMNVRVSGSVVLELKIPRGENTEG